MNKPPAVERGEGTAAEPLCFEELIVREGAALRRVAASYEADAGRAEDLFQEICLAIWRALPRFRGEASVRTFLFRIAHNRGLDACAQRRGPEVDLELASAVPDGAADPEVRAGQRELQERLLTALRVLPVAYRQVLSLALEGLSQREIADVVGITENNVAVRLTRARKALRAQLVPGG
jgi:RNA polymerase sigma factor (sigma-70 family)